MKKLPSIEGENGTGNSQASSTEKKRLADDSAGESAMDEALDYCQVAQDFWQKGELENALEALDQAYSLILRVDTYNSPKMIQQKEDLRFMISRRILEIYASRNTVVNGHHDAIPLTMNRHVQAEINSFTSANREKRFFIDSYKRSGLYHSFIVNELKEAGLPEELAWLPLIESGFKSHALSSARALGLWQFIPSTGYKFGLKRDRYIDERMDPEKATRAAIAYLKELHKIFGDWATVLAAYNCGEGRVLRVIRSQNVNYLDNFWDLYEKLPRETARYVPRFIATIYILKNPAKYGLDRIEPMPPMAFDRVTVEKRVHLRDVAKIIGVNQSDLKSLNPELRYGILPGEEYSLRVPTGTAETLLANMASLKEYSAPQSSYAYHRVRRGETLSTIANRYRTSVSRIMRANNLHKSHYIVAGQRLKIPQKGAAVRPSAGPVDMTSTRHKVKRGDSLWNIARRYGTTVGKIQSANHMNNTRLHIGQVLQIPGRQQASAKTQTISKSSAQVYTVKRGDTPFKIAKAHSMQLDQLLRLNKLSKSSTIYPGQSLQVE